MIDNQQLLRIKGELCITPVLDMLTCLLSGPGWMTSAPRSQRRSAALNDSKSGIARFILRGNMRPLKVVFLGGEIFLL